MPYLFLDGRQRPLVLQHRLRAQAQAKIAQCRAAVRIGQGGKSRLGFGKTAQGRLLRGAAVGEAGQQTGAGRLFGIFKAPAGSQPAQLRLGDAGFVRLSFISTDRRSQDLMTAVLTVPDMEGPMQAHQRRGRSGTQISRHLG